MDITAGADVAFVTALMRCAGVEKSGERIELGFRLTIGLRKMGGQWVVVHEHHSIPAGWIQESLVVSHLRSAKIHLGTAICDQFVNLSTRNDGNKSMATDGTWKEGHATRLQSLVRIGGTAAILAGLLRALISSASGLGEVEQQVVYFIVDLLLLLGVLAVYVQNHQVLGLWGVAGFLITIAGILLVRSSRAIPGLDLYPAGALAVVSGWVVLSATCWKRAHGSVFGPLLFVLAVATGAIGQFVTRAASLFPVSGIIFGAAMVEVGRQVLRAEQRRR
jgi:SnoaL-like domain